MWCCFLLIRREVDKVDLNCSVTSQWRGKALSQSKKVRSIWLSPKWKGHEDKWNRQGGLSPFSVLRSWRYGKRATWPGNVLKSEKNIPVCDLQESWINMNIPKTNCEYKQWHFVPSLWSMIELNAISQIYLSDSLWRKLRKHVQMPRRQIWLFITCQWLFPTSHLSPRFPQLPLTVLFHLLLYLPPRDSHS